MSSQLADYVLVVSLWCLVANQVVRLATKRAKWHPNTFGFIFFCAFTITFLVDGVYVWAGSLTGIADLAWLLSYCGWSLALYFMILWLYDVMQQSIGRWIKALSILMITFFCIIFVIGILPNAENSIPYREVARTPYELVFMSMLYINSLLLFTLPAVRFFRLWLVEENTAVRLHAFSMSIAMWCAIGFFATRCLFVVSNYFGLLIPKWVNDFAMSCLIVGGIMFAIFFFPDKWTLYLSGLKRSWQRLSNLRLLRSHIHKITPPIVPSHRLERQRWYDLDFCTYRAMIEILDGKRILPALVTGNRLLDQATLMMANDMSTRLADIDDHAPYEHLVEQYSQKGEQLKQETNSVTHIIAIWISRFVHPLIISLLALLAGLVLTTDWQTAVWWVGLFIMCVPVPLMTAVIVAKQTGRVTDLDVSVQQHRPLVYAFSVFLVLCTLYLFNRWQAPSVASELVILLILLGIALAVINRWTKISIHTATAVGCSLLLLTYSLPIGLIFLVASIAVSWSRLQLRHHTWQQIGLGWMVAIIVSVMLLIELI